MRKPLFKPERLLRTIDGNIFQVEKILGLASIDKDLIRSLDTGFPTYLSELFWDNLSHAILQKKAMPCTSPDIKITRIYDVRVCNDDNTSTFRVVMIALRSRTRGRRSNQFKKDQIDILSEYKPNYIKILIEQIQACVKLLV